jgi:hypothetical protein
MGREGKKEKEGTGPKSETAAQKQHTQGSVEQAVYCSRMVGYS